MKTNLNKYLHSQYHHQNHIVNVLLPFLLHICILFLFNILIYYELYCFIYATYKSKLVQRRRALSTIVNKHMYCRTNVQKSLQKQQRFKKRFEKRLCERLLGLEKSRSQSRFFTSRKLLRNSLSTGTGTNRTTIPGSYTQYVYIILYQLYINTIPYGIVS